MKSALFIILFIFSINIVYCQEKDTVISKLSALSDTNQVNLLANTINRVLFQDPNLALKYLEVYSQLPLVKSSQFRLCYIYTSKGVIYEMLGDFGLALEYDYKALNLAEKINDSVNIANSLDNIGFVYFNQSQQYDKSIEFHKKALTIWKALKDLQRISGAYVNIANDFRLLNNKDSALFYQKLSLQTFELVNETGFKYERYLALKYSGLAALFLNDNKADSALFYYDKAMFLLEKNSEDFELTEIYYGIGLAYFDKNNFQFAEKFYSKAITIAEELNLMSPLIKYGYAMAELQAQKGDFEGAYFRLSKLMVYADSVNSVKTRNKIAEVQGKYDNEKKQRRIEKLEYDSSVQAITERNYLYGIIGLVFLAMGVIILMLLKKKKDKLLAEQKELIYEKEKEIAKTNQAKSDFQKKELENELKFRNKELTTHALNMMQKNKLLDNLTARIDGFRKIANDDQKGEIRKIKREINNYLRTDKDWELFKIYFEQVNESFFDDLKKQFPSLSVNDLRLCALIKLDMNIKESASVLNVAPNTIKSARYRLRKKLQLKSETVLYKFVQEF